MPLFACWDVCLDSSSCNKLRTVSLILVSVPVFEQEMQHWKDLATEYHDELQQTPPPPPPRPPPPPTTPPHCKGIVTVYGASGSVDTGGPATDLEVRKRFGRCVCVVGCPGDFSRREAGGDGA
jgi:hypothetical protein